MPPNHFESEVESFLEGSHGDRTHIKRADHHTVTPLCGTLLSRQSSPGGTPRLLVREKVRPARSVPRLFREKVRPARHKPPILGYFSCAGRTFSRSHPPSGHAGRTFSRTRRSHVATMQPMTPLQQLIQASVKPPSPMLAPEQQPLKPTSPLHPQTAPKTPISHPQR